jgi:hypothetical protein
MACPWRWARGLRLRETADVWEIRDGRRASCFPRSGTVEGLRASQLTVRWRRRRPSQQSRRRRLACAWEERPPLEVRGKGGPPRAEIQKRKRGEIFRVRNDGEGRGIHKPTPWRSFRSISSFFSTLQLFLYENRAEFSRNSNFFSCIFSRAEFKELYFFVNKTHSKAENHKAEQFQTQS